MGKRIGRSSRMRESPPEFRDYYDANRANSPSLETGASLSVWLKTIYPHGSMESGWHPPSWLICKSLPNAMPTMLRECSLGAGRPVITPRPHGWLR